MKGKKRLEHLHPRLRDTYNMVQRLEQELGAPPSVREVVRGLNLNKQHISRVHGDMLTLVKLELLEKGPIPTRCYRAIGPPADEIDWEGLILGLG